MKLPRVLQRLQQEKILLDVIAQLPPDEVVDIVGLCAKAGLQDETRDDIRHGGRKAYPNLYGAAVEISGRYFFCNSDSARRTLSDLASFSKERKGK